MSKYTSELSQSDIQSESPQKKAEYERLINQFIQYINETKYYEAHEALEEIWFPRRFEDNVEMKLIKGFINAAVSFELIKRGRPESSERVWKNFEKYIILLGTFESPHNSRYEELDHFLRQKKRQLTSNL